MTKRFSLSALLLLAVTLLVPAAVAADVQEGRIIHAVFSLDSGESTEFRIPDGGTVNVTQQETGRQYTLAARVRDDGAVELSLDELSNVPTKERFVVASDRLRLEVGGEPRKSRLAPFSLAVTGVSFEAPVFAEPAAPFEKAAPAPEGSGSCCVSCGGWIVCCSPRPGYCCTVTSSCGTGCSVCS